MGMGRFGFKLFGLTIDVFHVRIDIKIIDKIIKHVKRQTGHLLGAKMEKKNIMTVKMTIFNFRRARNCKPYKT